MPGLVSVLSLRLTGTIEADHGCATLTVDHAEPVEAGEADPPDPGRCGPGKGW